MTIWFLFVCFKMISENSICSRTNFISWMGVLSFWEICLIFTQQCVHFCLIRTSTVASFHKRSKNNLTPCLLVIFSQASGTVSLSRKVYSAMHCKLFLCRHLDPSVSEPPPFLILGCTLLVRPGTLNPFVSSLEWD